MKFSIFCIRKNFSFFCSCMKMTPGAIEDHAISERVPYLESKNFDAGSQNQNLQTKPQSSKSLKCNIFEDYISKIVIRLSLFLLVFIFCVSGWRVPAGEGVMGEKSLIVSGDWRQFFREY